VNLNLVSIDNKAIIDINRFLIQFQFIQKSLPTLEKEFAPDFHDWTNRTQIKMEERIMNYVEFYWEC
jgi:hypothetical protein